MCDRKFQKNGTSRELLKRSHPTLWLCCSGRVVGAGPRPGRERRNACRTEYSLTLPSRAPRIVQRNVQCIVQRSARAGPTGMLV